MKRWIVYPRPQINVIGISAPSFGCPLWDTSRLFAVNCCFFLQSNIFYPGPSNFHLQFSTLTAPFWEPHHEYDDSTTKKNTAVCCSMLVDCCVALVRLGGSLMTRFGHTSCTVPRLPVPSFFTLDVDFEVYRALIPTVGIPTPSYAFPQRATHSSLAVGCCIILKSPPPPTVKPFFHHSQNVQIWASYQK